MVALQPSISLLDGFLLAHGYALDTHAHLGDLIVKKKTLILLPADIIDRIIGDAYNYANPLVKQIYEHLESHFSLYLGRVQKKQLKTYIDYERPQDLAQFFELITVIQAMKAADSQEGDTDVDEGENKQISQAIRTSISTHISTVIATFKPHLQVALLDFHTKFREAVLNHRDARIKDYLIFLYSRLVGFNEHCQPKSG